MKKSIKMLPTFLDDHQWFDKLHIVYHYRLWKILAGMERFCTLVPQIKGYKMTKDVLIVRPRVSFEKIE